MSTCRSFRNTLTKVVLRGCYQAQCGSSSVVQGLLEPLRDGNASENRSHTMGNYEYLEIIIRGTMFLSCKKTGGAAMLLPSERGTCASLGKRIQFILSLVMPPVSGNHPTLSLLQFWIVGHQ